MTVPAISAESLINEFDLHAPDLVGIDTEGFDAIAVRLLIEAGMRPTMLVYEHAHVRGDDDQECRDELTAMGYLLARANRDTIAVHGEASSPLEGVWKAP